MTDVPEGRHNMIDRDAYVYQRDSGVKGAEPVMVRRTVPAWRQCEYCGCSEGAIEAFGWIECDGKRGLT